MKHLQFFLKYYKYYHDLEIAYTPDWIFDKKRQQRLHLKYDDITVFHNDEGKNFDQICLMSKSGKKYYKKMSMMSNKEKMRFIADFLSEE